MSQSKLLSPMPEYFPAFDWLRLILAMAVALSHHGAPMDPNAANFAVQVFFALSGWLIGGILLDTDRKELPRFYYNRATRIWAPYYFSVALLFATSLLKEPFDANWLEYLFYEITYTHNWFISPRLLEIKNDLPLDGTTNHFWSLSVEEQFYLFAPLIIFFAPAGRTAITWALIAMLAVCFQTYYGAIALGVLAVTLQRRFGDWQTRETAPYMIMTAIAGVFGLYLASPENYHFLAPFGAILIVLLLARPGRKSAFGSFLGGISFPLYLNHWIGIFLAEEISQRFAFVENPHAIVIGGVLNLAIASVLYVAIDEQVRKRRGSWYTGARAKAAAIAAYVLVVAGAAGGFMIAAASA